MAPAAHAPLFSHGGEMHAAGQLSEFGQVDAQVALAPADHLGLVAALSVYPWDDEGHKHYYGEAGVGGFLPFGIGRFEGFVGGGYGRSWGDLGTAETRTDSNYYRMFAQFDIGLATRVVDFGLMTRFAWVSFESVSAGQAHGSEDLYLEPMLFLRLGWDFIKIEFQGGLVYPILWNVSTWFVPFHFSMGLHFCFDLWGGGGGSADAPAATDNDGWGPEPSRSFW
jgi:hypothetical protein